MSSCKPVDTLVSKGEALSLNMCPKNPQEREEMSRVPYASVVGSLMYDMMCTRPNICFVIGLVSRYQSNTGRELWKAAKKDSEISKGYNGLLLGLSRVRITFGWILRCQLGRRP